MTAASAENIGVGAAGASSRSFVINLASSTSPMALSHPASPELKRFTFFVSRQREDGRERFRLHMGYFTTQEEAELLLESVRHVYPAAWAGPAPSTGVGRRGRVAAGNVVTGAFAAPAMTPVPAVSAEPAAPVAPVEPAAAPRAAPQAATATPPLDEMSNVRDVLAQLSESGAASAATDTTTVAPRLELVAMGAPPSPVQPAAPELSSADALQLLESSAVVPALALAEAPVIQKGRPAVEPGLPPPLLPPLKNPFEGLENEPEVRLVTPEDTQTLTDIKIDRQNNAPPCFAVQLIWSVSPIDVATLPHLAIFDAYTLYNVEGNRQGRRWYGLRLGFFSDPNSASQVANYVRSEYRNVAVVPVAVKERDRARGGSAPAVAADVPRKTTEADLRREKMEGFELLADDRPVPARRDIGDAGAGAPAQVPRVSPKRPSPAAATGPAGTPVGKRVVARRRDPVVQADKKISAGVGGAEVLESTLEILGASTLSLDEGGREIITDAAARKPADKKSSAGAGRFSRLLSRLSGG